MVFLPLLLFSQLPFVFARFPSPCTPHCVKMLSKKKNVEGNVPSITIKTTLPFAIPSENNNFYSKVFVTHSNVCLLAVATTSTSFRGLLN